MASVTFAGRAHAAGASRAGGLRSRLGFMGQVLQQALTMRRHPAFRVADVLHANTTRAALYSVLAALGTRKPVVVSLRDIIDRDALGSLGYVLTTRLTLKRASGLIACSATALASARDHIRTDLPAEVIPSPSGIDLRDASVEVKDDLRTVGMVARLDTWKGQDLLIRAFARAFPDSDTRLLLAGAADFGREEYEDELRRLADQLGVGPRVEFLGHVEDVPALIRSLDVCVQASTRPEPLGQNVLQYLALGRPTVATDVGGPAEWIDDGVNGLTFRMGDLDSLAGALERLRDPGLRRRLAQNAAKTPGLMSDAEVTSAHARFFQLIADRKGQR